MVVFKKAYKEFIFSSIKSTGDPSATKGSGSSLKPSSCCLRPSQTVDLTLYGVRGRIQRRGGKRHDRWTYKSTTGFWKIVTEQPTRGDPLSVHTPSTESVRYYNKLRFQTEGICVAILCMHAGPCISEDNRVSVSLGVLAWSGQIKVGRQSFPPALISLRVVGTTCFSDSG